MNAVVVGGYGFIGSHICEKLIKEKHNVTVIDDLSSGDQSNLSLKHNSFVWDASSHRCQNIFAKEPVDVIVFAANQRLDLKAPTEVHNKAGNLVGLRHMLELALKYKVKKFVFLSSYKVYELGCQNIDESAPLNPSNDAGVDYLYQEQFCRDFMKKGMDISILRLANVYGPRLHEHSGNLITLMATGKKGLETHLEDKLEFFQDHIYVTDVADAVLKTIENVTSFKVLNISSNQNYTNSEVLATMEDFVLQRVQRESTLSLGEQLASASYSLCNKLAYKAVGWHPQTPLEEGIKKYAKWLEKVQPSKETKKEESDVKKDSLLKKLFPYVETTGVYLVFLCLRFFMLNTLQLDVDVMIIFVVMISIFYGMNLGAYAVLLAIVTFLMEKLAHGHGVAYIMFNVQYIFAITVYVLVGMFSGYSMDKGRYKLRLLNRELSDHQQELTFIREVYDKSIKIKNVLQQDLENYEDSFGKVIQITEKLNKVNAEEVYHEAVKVIAEVMKAKRVGILYIDYQGEYGRLMASCGGHQFPKSMKVKEYDFLDQVIQEKKTFINRDLNVNKPMLSAPILYNQQVSAILLIDQIEFDQLSLRNINMLRVLSMLISNAMDNAHQYQEAVEKMRFYKGTQILRPKWFKEIHEVRSAASEEQLSSSYLLETNMSLEEGISEYSSLADTIRKMDYIGVLENGKIGISFANADEKDQEILRSRLNTIGFDSKWRAS